MALVRAVAGRLAERHEMARIIIIDDDPLFTKLLSHQLTSAGHKVVHNLGSEGALTAVRQQTFDLILVDVQMPGIEGPKLVEYFRSRGVGGARIVLMSSLPEEVVKRLAQEYGADAAFCKTSGIRPLLSLVQAVEQSSRSQLAMEGAARLRADPFARR